MYKEKLIKIIQEIRKKRSEWETVDAKSELTLKEEGDKAEFVKDIAAMANNGEKSFLIVGLKDNSFDDAGVLKNHYQKNDLNQILEGKIDPPITVDYEEFEINGFEYAIVEVLGENPPYIIAKDISFNKSDRKRSRVFKGQIFIRHKDRTVGASRIELETLLERGFRSIFKGESERAKMLGYVQPPDWVYLLTIELLKSRMHKINEKWNELEKGLIFNKSKILDREHFNNFSSEKLHDLINLVKILSTLIGEELPKSWKNVRASRNPTALVKTIDEISSACLKLLEWQIEVQSSMPPDTFVNLKNLLKNLPKGIFESIEKIPKTLMDFIKKPATLRNSEIHVTIIIPPANDIIDELKRIKRNEFQ